MADGLRRRRSVQPSSTRLKPQSAAEILKQAVARRLCAQDILPHPWAGCPCYIGQFLNTVIGKMSQW
jgi:hypothetical protein